jgi:hypothetical protein
MAKCKSVKIKLTEEQQKAIKKATGKDLSVLKLQTMEGRKAPAIMKVPVLTESTDQDHKGS